MDTELKPCPFCGDEGAYEKHQAKLDAYCVRCNCCLARSDEVSSKQGAADDWNTRAPTEREAAFNIEIRKLKSLLSDARDKFKQYEMDVDDSAPESHRKFMARMETALDS